MPQQHLHHPKIRAVVEQVGGKACRKVCGDKGTLTPARPA